MTIFIAIQLIGIFACHYIMTTFTRKIHEPSRAIAHQLVANQHRVGDLRTKIRFVHHCFFTLHTTTRYGATYGTFGLVTMKTFAQVCYSLMQYKLWR